MNTTNHQSMMRSKMKLVLWVVVSVVGFAISYTYGPLARTYIEYQVFDFYQLGDLLFNLLDTLFYCLIFFGVPVFLQALLLGGKRQSFLAWLPASLIGSYLGYLLLIYVHYDYAYFFLISMVRSWIMPLLFLPDLILIDAPVAFPAVYVAGIYGLMCGTIFGLILGAVQYLFLRKTKLVKPGWIVWVGLLFGLIGSLNSTLITYLNPFYRSAYQSWSLNWDHMINNWLLLIGAIVGLIYGLGTGWVLRRNSNVKEY